MKDKLTELYINDAIQQKRKEYRYKFNSERALMLAEEMCKSPEVKAVLRDLAKS